MSRLSKLLLVGLAVLLLLPAAAYADQTDEARSLLEEANALVDQVNELDAVGRELLAAVGQVGDATAKNAADALPILRLAAASNDKVIVTLQSVVALYDEAAALDISPELESFMGQRKEWARLNLELYTLTGETIAKAETAYRDWDRLSGSERTALRSDLVALATQMQALSTEIDEKQATAEQYYADNGLDEELAVSSSWTTSLVKNFAFLAVIGFGALLLGRWYRRRKLRRAVPELDRGDQDGPDAEPEEHESEPSGAK